MIHPSCVRSMCLFQAKVVCCFLCILPGGDQKDSQEGTLPYITAFKCVSVVCPHSHGFQTSHIYHISSIYIQHDKKLFTIWHASKYDYLKTNTYLADRLGAKDSALRKLISSPTFSQATHKVSDILHELHTAIRMVGGTLLYLSSHIP